MDDDKETSVIQSNKETQIILIDEKFVSQRIMAAHHFILLCSYNSPR
jgi:hypothetical protein